MPISVSARARPFQWLLPDLAFTAAAIVLFYSLFLFRGYQAFFHDSDSGWHIRAGELILSVGILPSTDPFSFTAAGKPWFAWEWLADVIVGTVHQFWGLSGVALFYALVLATTVWFWFRLNRAAGGAFLFAALFAAPMLSTTGLHWLARPHLISWLFLILIVTWVRPDRPEVPIARIAALSCVWANTHASFLLGPAILAIFAAGSLLRPLFFTPAPSQTRALCAAGLISLAATFVNPYGVSLHRHVLSYLTDSQLLDRVGEFQSFNFHLPGSAQILLTLAFAAIGGAASLARKDLGSFLLIFLLLALALRSARGLPLVALLALPLANGAITQAFRSAQNLNSSFRKKLNSALAYSDRLGALDLHANGLVWAPALIFLAALALRTPAIAAQTGFPPNEFPVAASRAIAELPQAARILAPDKFGGYLIYRFAGARKVFFDGRSDLYGAQFLIDYATLTQLRPNWETILNRHHFTHALLPQGAPLIAALTARGWTTLLSDPVATVLQSPRD